MILFRIYLNTTPVVKLSRSLLQCHLKVFSNPLSPFKEPKIIESVFQVSERVFSVLK